LAVETSASKTRRRDENVSQERVVTPNSNPTERLITVEAFVKAIRLNDKRCEMHIQSNAASSGKVATSMCEIL